jgi:hypothetical protein
MQPDNVTIAIYHVVCAAQSGNPYMQALQVELARLYDAAGEHRPHLLSNKTPNCHDDLLDGRVWQQFPEAL